jgi:hypothetical protein
VDPSANGPEAISTPVDALNRALSREATELDRSTLAHTKSNETTASAAMGVCIIASSKRDSAITRLLNVVHTDDLTPGGTVILGSASEQVLAAPRAHIVFASEMHAAGSCGRTLHCTWLSEIPPVTLKRNCQLVR